MLVDGDCRHRFARIRTAERVARCAIFRLQAIEILVGKQTAISDLPRADVYARHSKCIGRFCGP
jgi:hypothetical protein